MKAVEIYKKIDKDIFIEIEKIMDNVTKKKKLRRLELEGNFFGPETATAFADALKKNNTLRYLDLENINLTEQDKNIEGMKNLFLGLQSNTMLISLNFAINYLTPDIGSQIIDMFRTNKTIINLEIFQNKDFIDRPNDSNKKDENSKYISAGLTRYQIEEIKNALKRNYDKYIQMRTD